MQSNSFVFQVYQTSQSFLLLPEMSGGPNILPVLKLCKSSVNQDLQVSTVSSGSPCPQYHQAPQNPLTSKDTPKGPRRQQKKTRVFSSEQKQVLEQYFNKCIYVTKEQCLELSQRFGLRRSHIKVSVLSCLPFL